MASLRRSLALAALSRYTAQAIAILSSMVLARLLLPADIGVYSIGTAILAFIHVLRDFGVSSYLIREPELSAAKTGTCFTVSLGIAWLAGIGLLLGTPPIARLYQQPGLETVLYILTAGLFVIPFNSIRLALLQREMRFDALLRIEIASAMVNAAVSIVLAQHGYGFVGLAWAGFASIIVTLALSRCMHVSAPIGRPSLAAWRAVSSFGGASLLVNLIIRLGTQAPALIVGKTLGMQATGLLSRAIGMADLLQTLGRQSIGLVVLPDIARKLREGRDITGDYLRALTYTSVISLTVAGFLMLEARSIILLMFGPNWVDAVALVRIFSVSALFLPLVIFNAPFLTAAGHINLQLRTAALCSPGKIGAWLLAAPLGIAVAAWAAVAAQLLNLSILSVLLARVLNIEVRRIAIAFARGLPVALLALTAPTAMQLFDLAARYGDAVSLVCATASCGLVWLTALYLFRHPLRAEITLAVSAALRAWTRIRVD